MDNQIEIYQTNNGTEIAVLLSNQTIWLDKSSINSQNEITAKKELLYE